MARDRTVDAADQADHADDRSRVHGAGGALVVERHVAARDGRVERPTRVRDTPTRLAKLIKHGRPFGAAEVQAIGDPQGARTGARDVARRLGDRRLAAFERIEQHVAGIAVGCHRDAERGIPDPNHSRAPCCFQVARYTPSSVTRPIGVAVSSHFAAMAWICGRRSALATTSIRSWDSESRISYGVIPGSRVGTRARSISTPTPPRAAI